MTKASTLAKLHTLLERVRARSSMPRNGQAGPAKAAVAAPEPLAVQEVDVAPPPATPEPRRLLRDEAAGAQTMPPPSLEEVEVEEISVEIEVGEPESASPPPVAVSASPEALPFESAPPPAAPLPFESAPPPTAPLPFESAPPPAAPLPFETEPPPAAPPVPEGTSPAASESAERLVAAERVPSEPPVAVVSGAATPAAEAPSVEIEAVAPPPAPIEPEVDSRLPPVEEAPGIPAAPASSRRPVAPESEEHLTEMAFGADEPVRPPRHTPPPESGRLPAAPVDDFDADVTGVRSAPSAGAAPPLAPVEIHASIPPSAAVVEVVGAPPPFEPATFAAWLDATLGL